MASLQQKDGRTDEALATLDQVIESDPDAPYPYYRRALMQRRIEMPDEAELSLREALVRTPETDSLADIAWPLWWEIMARDLGHNASAAKSILDELLARRKSKPGDFPSDLQWGLEKLESRKALRINCGGDEYLGEGDRLWSRDRFFQGGRLYLDGEKKFEDEIDNTEDDYIYQTERWFPPLGSSRYRVPLPRGKYRVILHFAEIWKPNVGRRKFEVLLVENGKKLSEYTPPFATADVKSFEIELEDGFLDIEFLHVENADNPKISALEISRLSDS
jgi:hypothetical protein